MYQNKCIYSPLKFPKNTKDIENCEWPISSDQKLYCSCVEVASTKFQTLQISTFSFYNDSRRAKVTENKDNSGLLLTIAAQTLPEQSVQQGSAMVAKCGRHESVRAEPVRHIYLETLPQVLPLNKYQQN